MSAGLYELIAWPVELIQRGGKLAGALAIIIGLILVPCGLWLTFKFPGPDHIWPIMLSVSAFGLGIAGAGLAAFVGTQAKLAAFDVETDAVPQANVALSTAGLPFWVCGSCKIARPGVSMTERCEQCGSIIDYMAVEHESDRKLAVGLMS